VLYNLAWRAGVDQYELALALALEGVTQVGMFDFATCPNDPAMVQAIRQDDQQAKAYVGQLTNSMPIGQVSALLRCSNTWIKAAILRWGLKTWPTNRPSVTTPPEETRLAALPLLERRTLLTDAWRQHKQWKPEAAWSLGVTKDWFGGQLMLHGLVVNNVKAKVTVPGRVTRKTPQEEKNAVLNAMLALGSIAEWARATNIPYPTAVRYAQQVGWAKAKPRTSLAERMAPLQDWLQANNYHPTIDAAVSTRWLDKNVLQLPSAHEYDRTKTRQCMRELGYRLVERDSDLQKVWIDA
jgi:hypothetical protein